jgi:hypothetical protein
MIRKIVLTSALALALAVPASARAETYFGFQIGIGNAPTRARVTFAREPRMVLIPRTDVYVAEGDFGYDVFRVGAAWYLCDDGRWYRANSRRGPFRIVDVRRVPRDIFYVPSREWRHHYAGLPGNDRVADRQNDRGHGRGHDRGQDRGRHDRND